MRKVLFFFFLLPLLSTAQNLVLNSHLDTGINCSLINNTLYHFSPAVIADWYSPGQEAQYYNSCATISEDQTPANHFGYQTPRSGDGYAGFYCGGFGQHDTLRQGTNERKYVTGTLSHGLDRDSFYCVSFYISLADTSPIATDRIGVYFSNTIPTYNNILDPLPYTPQLVSRSGFYFTDKVNWTRISALYRASGGEIYITIGNYNDSTNTHIYKVGIFNQGLSHNSCFYYLDDVSVVPVSSGFAHPLGADTVLCDTVGFSRVLSVPSQLFDSIHWSTGATGGQIAIDHIGAYWVDCFNGECHSTDTIHIAYHAPYLFSQYTDTSICADKLPLHICTQSGFTGYRWSTGDTLPALVAISAGLYIVSYSTICGQEYDSISIHTKVVPAPPGTRDTTLCTNGSIGPLTAMGTALRWYAYAADSTPTVTPPIPDIHGASSQIYYVTQSINGCESPKAHETVYLASAPRLDLGSDQTHCMDHVAELGRPAMPNTQYRWSTGDSTSIIYTDRAGLYSCEAENFCGVSQSAVSIFYINCDSECLYIPNAFTPNGDGINDFLELSSRCPFSYFVIQIYSRWGEKIFESNDIGHSWDGNYQGNQQPAGVYIYNLYLTNESGKTEQRKGGLTLIR